MFCKLCEIDYFVHSFGHLFDSAGRNFGPLQYSHQDLVMQTIMRGRDHGLADYNTARRAFNLTPVDTWEDINPSLYDSNPEVSQKLTSDMFINHRSITKYIKCEYSKHTSGNTLD